MNPWLIIAALAGAFWAIREYGRRKEAGTLPWGGRAPLGLPPAEHEVPTSPQGAINLGAWAAIGWNADIFPAHASRQSLPPPPENGVSAAPDCSAIAVGHGWWERVALLAETGYDAGLSDFEIADRVEDELLRRAELCIDERAPAAMVLMQEVLERIRAGRIQRMVLVPGALVIPPTPGRDLQINPAARRGAAERLLLRALTGRRWS